MKFTILPYGVMIFYPFVIKKSGVIDKPNNEENEWTKDDIYYEEADKTGLTRIGHFYNFLKLFSDISKTSQRPFWAFCMSQGHKGLKPVNNDASEYTYVSYQPAPTIGMLRFEAFNALAFGAQGILYWRCGQGPAEAYSYKKDDKGNKIITEKTEYLTALIGRDGKLSDVYYAAKEVNEQIAKYSYVFLGGEMVEFAHSSISNSNHLESLTQPVFSKTMYCVSKLTADGNGVLISKIKNGNKRYVVIVNHDAFDETTYEVAMHPMYSGKFLTGTPQSFPDYTGIAGIDSTDTFKRTLKPGDWDIIECKLG